MNALIVFRSSKSDDMLHLMAPIITFSHLTLFAVQNLDLLQVDSLIFLVMAQYTVKSHFKALGLYNFKRGFGWGLYHGGHKSGIKKCFRTMRYTHHYLHFELYL